MRGKIISSLLVLYIFAGMNTPAQAEGLFGMPIKSPFNNIFSDKKEATPIVAPVDAQSAKVETTEKKMKPKVIYDPNNPLGIIYAENVVNKAEFYMEEGDTKAAQDTMKQVMDWVSTATEYHTDLYRALKKVNNSEIQADTERELAVKFAILRDRLLFLDSKIQTLNGNKKQAVKDLVSVVESQPSTDLGFKAYEALQKLGFCCKIEFEMVKDSNTEAGAK